MLNLFYVFFISNEIVLFDRQKFGKKSLKKYYKDAE